MGEDALGKLPFGFNQVWSTWKSVWGVDELQVRPSDRAFLLWKLKSHTNHLPFSQDSWRTPLGQLIRNVMLQTKLDAWWPEASGWHCEVHISAWAQQTRVCACQDNAASCGHTWVLTSRWLYTAKSISYSCHLGWMTLQYISPPHSHSGIQAASSSWFCNASYYACLHGYCWGGKRDRRIKCPVWHLNSVIKELWSILQTFDLFKLPFISSPIKWDS